MQRDLTLEDWPTHPPPLTLSIVSKNEHKTQEKLYNYIHLLIQIEMKYIKHNCLNMVNI